MKRGADKQLSKDDDQDDVVEVCAHSYRVRCATMCLNHVILSTGSLNWFPNGQGLRFGKTRVRLFVTFPLPLWALLTDIVGYVVFQSEEAPPSHQCFHQPAVPPYVLTLPYLPLHLHQHPITSNQLPHKGSAVFQDSDQPAAQHPLSLSRRHLRLLAQL